MYLMKMMKMIIRLLSRGIPFSFIVDDVGDEDLVLAVLIGDAPDRDAGARRREDEALGGVTVAIIATLYGAVGVVVLLGEVVLWFMSVDEVELELELDGVVLVLELLGLVPAAAAPWSLGVVPVLVLLAAPLGLLWAGVWLETGGF